MALWQLDQFAPAQFLGFIRALEPPNDYQGTRWLPDDTVTDSEFSYVLGSFQRPVMATIMGYDSNTPLHSRSGQGATVAGELPLIKRKDRIGEKTIQRFLTPRAGTPDQQQAITDVFIRAADLFDAVQARTEWLRMQALSEQTIVYDEDGVMFNFDFGIRIELELRFTATGAVTVAINGSTTNATDFTVGKKWTDTANSNPVLDLQALQRRATLLTGRPFAEMVCSDIIQGLLQSNVQLRQMIRGTDAPSAVLTVEEINTLFGLYKLPLIRTYDVLAQHEEEDGSLADIRMMAQNRAFFVQAGLTVGKTLWGPTAESRVLYGTPLAGQAPGIFAETYGTTEPPAEYVKVAAAAFPTMPQAQNIAQVELFPASDLGALTSI